MMPGPKSWLHSIKDKPIITLFIFCLILSIFLGSPRGLIDISKNPVDSIRLTRIILLLVTTFASYLYIFFGAIHHSNGYAIKSFLLYSFLAMFSSAYSAYPLFTLWKGFEVFAFASFGLMLGRYLKSLEDLQDLINIISFFLLFLIISALLNGIIMPNEAFVKLKASNSFSFILHGSFPLLNANTLTQLSGIVALISLNNFLNHYKIIDKLSFFFIYFLATIILLLSHSRTSLLAYFITFMLIILIYNKKKLFIFLTWITSIAIISGLISKIVLPYIYRGQSQTLFLSLSGRTEFWPLVWNKFLQSPLFGYGFYTAQRFTWGVGSVDNTYLEVLIGLGLIGFIVFIVPLVNISILLLKTYFNLNNNKFLWTNFAILFIFLFIRSLTGPSFQVLHIDMLCYVILMVTLYSYSKAMLKV